MKVALFFEFTEVGIRLPCRGYVLGFMGSTQIRSQPFQICTTQVTISRSNFPVIKIKLVVQAAFLFVYRRGAFHAISGLNRFPESFAQHRCSFFLRNFVICSQSTQQTSVILIYIAERQLNPCFIRSVAIKNQVANLGQNCDKYSGF